MSCNSDPISSATAGVTRGVIQEGKSLINEWVRKFKDGELAFIGDIETIDLAKEQRTSGEYDFFKTYVKNKEHRVLFNMGLALRRLEKDGKSVGPLKEAIRKKFDYKGLRIAHFVQNGLLNKYLGIILERATTPGELTKEIGKLFDDIDKVVSYVQTSDAKESDSKVNEIVAKVRVDSPTTFVISSSKSAMDICQEVTSKVESQLSNYTCEHYQGKKGRKIFFLIREEDEFKEE